MLKKKLSSVINLIQIIFEFLVGREAYNAWGLSLLGGSFRWQSIKICDYAVIWMH